MLLRQEKAVWNMLCEAFGQKVAGHWMDVCISIFESKVTTREDDGGMIIYLENPIGCGDTHHFALDGKVVSGTIETPCSLE